MILMLVDDDDDDEGSVDLSGDHQAWFCDNRAVRRMLELRIVLIWLADKVDDATTWCLVA